MIDSRVGKRHERLCVIAIVCLLLGFLLTPVKQVHAANQAPYYYLPWLAGQPHYVSQGNNGSVSHTGLEQYAWDFSGDGWVIYNARAGYVSWLRDDQGPGGCDQTKYQNAANYVLVRSTNPDNIQCDAQYLHLAQGSASSRVSLNAAVAAGVPVGVTDSSGYVCPDPVPTGAHLHYMVQGLCASWNCQSVQSSFLDPNVLGQTQSSDGVPKTGETVTSSNAAVTPALVVDGILGDVVGNGLIDIISVNDAQVIVMRPRTDIRAFNPPQTWWSWTGPGSYVPPYGNRATLLGDVTGSGKAALVAVNDNNTYVMTSTGTSFGNPGLWTNTPFFGTKATLLADVNGDGKADLIAVNDSNTYVMLSTGTGFGAPVLWSGTPFYGNKATLAGRVRGIAKADLVAVNDNNTFVMPVNATGTGFDQPQPWSTGAFYGNRATILGDVNNDGMQDVVAINSDSVWVMLSNGSAFVLQPTPWLSSTSPPPYGTRTTLLGGVIVARWADLVAVNDSNTLVMPSYVRADGTGYFGSATEWWSQAFYGARATL